MYRRFVIVASLLSLVWMSAACSKPAAENAEAPAANGASVSQAAQGASASQEITLPAGTVVTVRLASAVGSKLSTSGDHFSATVAQPVEVDGKVAVPAGTEALGEVVEAVPQGRFKGAAVLRLVLQSITVHKHVYDVETSSASRSVKGKGKRTATLIGGGAGAGALIGGLAGGGKGALIGAAAGAGAGTAGAAYTGEKEIVLPAETTLSFRLAEPLTVRM